MVKLVSPFAPGPRRMRNSKRELVLLLVSKDQYKDNEKTPVLCTNQMTLRAMELVSYSG